MAMAMDGPGPAPQLGHYILQLSFRCGYGYGYLQLEGLQV